MNTHHEALIELFKQTSFPNNLANCVHNLLGGKKIILYGAGDGFITFSVFVLRKYGLKAYAVLDRKFGTGDIYCEIPAFSPSEYKPTSEEKEDSVVVVTIGKSAYHKEIFARLSDLGFKNIVLAHDIYEYHLHHSPAELVSKGFSYYLENQARITECFKLFQDNLSREVFTRFISIHMQKKPISIPSLPIEEQYFPKDINLRKGYSRFINCGSYNGDTVMQLNALHGKVDAIACFEPDLRNFELLTRYLHAERDALAQNVMAFPCGVFSHETQLHFADGDRINSAISDSGESVIQCVALDHVLPGFNPTFINMDVEGAECEALRGAEALIRESTPDLAICVYHSPNHIWDVPLYIESLGLGYSFYLRNYTSFIAETVLYATVRG